MLLLSIWRYSHLTLAISSFSFLIIAAFTGIILSFDPIVEEVNTYTIPKASEQSLAKTIELLQKNYDEIIELQITKSSLVKVSGVTKNGDTKDVYINPFTGKPITEIPEQKSIFKWVTALHRSLFLKSTGRIIIGVVSFLLFLISISGIVLIVKRQGNLKSFFSKVINNNFYEYTHVIFGRVFLIPIVIIAFTGVYLSLEKFSLLPKQTEKHHVDYDNISQKTQKNDLAVFKNTFLKDVIKLEFPFSNDVEDYYVLKLNNKELYIHQYTGTILSELNTSTWKQFYAWSFVLHTGKGSILWSLVLLVSSISILFFIYSGFNITWQRIQKKGKKVKNKYSKDQVAFVILVGSETGSTFSFATAFYNVLIKQHKKAYICSLNDYSYFKNIEHLIVITATYGDGEAPKNAEKFFKLYNLSPITKNIQFSVVGFGDSLYPDFCKYASDIELFLSQQNNCKTTMPICKIDKQSFNAFQQWTTDWGNQLNISLNIAQPKFKTQKYKVISKTALDTNDTFIITLKPLAKKTMVSGDLIGIKPGENELQRLYSIAIIDKKIVLSIKKHEYGLCSNYLYSLNKNNVLNANVIENKSFHLPKNNAKTLLIANGTGIAPFLGMIHENTHKQSIELFVGLKNMASSGIYQSIIKQALNNKQLEQVHYAYSRSSEKEYVQDVLLKNPTSVINTLQNNGTIMICGSIKMRDSVFVALNQITQKHFQLPIEHLKELGIVKTDCY